MPACKILLLFILKAISPSMFHDSEQEENLPVWSCMSDSGVGMTPAAADTRQLSRGPFSQLLTPSFMFSGIRPGKLLRGPVDVCNVASVPIELSFLMGRISGNTRGSCPGRKRCGNECFCCP